ncbi:hypothetical protein KY332_01365 [Candidatus Woesearchaeota archaeon]|nr:hypothetical protein [Candidatus Woesearchaeota archaeon]
MTENPYLDANGDLLREGFYEFDASEEEYQHLIVYVRKISDEDGKNLDFFTLSGQMDHLGARIEKDFGGKDDDANLDLAKRLIPFDINDFAEWVEWVQGDLCERVNEPLYKHLERVKKEKGK